jgi:two-component system LytT family sensor kinase
LLFSLAYIGFLILEEPYFSIHGNWLSYLPTFCVHFSLMVLIVVVNTGLLIPKLFVKKRITLYIISLAVLIAVFTLIRAWYHKYIFGIIYHNKFNGIGTDFGDSFVYADWFVIVSSMLYITQKWFDHQQQAKSIQITQLQNELKYLRSQVNPHFLFNGLNTIYAYIDSSNEKARKITVQFSDLLRYNLYEADVDYISLDKEVKHLLDYVELQKVRSNDNMQIEINATYEDGSAKIAPLIFMPFIENAFKYVSRGDNRLNFVRILLTQEGKEILFKCENSFDVIKSTTGGIGLSNTVRRLELLYKDKFLLDFKKEENIYGVYLKLTL